jgi:hypothetical protein
MIAARFSGFAAAPLNSAQPWSSNGTPPAGTGLMPARRSTRSGASARIRCAAVPPIECPTSENRSQPSSSATASASALISASVCSPATSRRLPYPR